MANTLTNLAADMYLAADMVGRELTGTITSSTINAGSQGAAKGDTVRSHVTPEVALVDITPAMTIPEGTDQTVTSKTMTLDKYKGVQIPWRGEEQMHVNNGSGFSTVYGDQIKQAMRAIANAIEIDAATEAYQNASRAVGTAGTTPFASDFDLVAQARQVIVDNGFSADEGLTSIVMNTLAGTNLRNLAQLQKANEAGSAEMLRRGTLLDLQGFMLKESAGIQSHTKGTGASFVTNGTFAVGDTTISIDGGTGTVLAGDVVTFVGDTNKYVVETALAAGDIVIQGPGLRAALADGVAMTVGNSFTGNFAIHRSALEIAVRPGANPAGGDSAVDSMIVQDPVSGLAFEVRDYRGYHKAMFEVSAVWGAKAWNGKAIAALLG